MTKLCKKCSTVFDESQLVGDVCIWCEDTKEILIPGFMRAGHADQGRLLRRSEYKHCTDCGGRIKTIDYGVPNRKPERCCVKCGKNYDEVKKEEKK